MPNREATTVGREIDLALDSLIRATVAPFTGCRNFARAALGYDISSSIAGGADPLRILTVLREAVARVEAQLYE